MAKLVIQGSGDVVEFGHDKDALFMSSEIIRDLKNVI